MKETRLATRVSVRAAVRLTEALAPQGRAADAATPEEIQKLGQTVDSAINLSSSAKDAQGFQYAAARFKEAIHIADRATTALARDDRKRTMALRAQIGRASCRERV